MNTSKVFSNSDLDLPFDVKDFAHADADNLIPYKTRKRDTPQPITYLKNDAT